MSRYTFISLLIGSLLTAGATMADEVSRSTSTEVNSPGYSSSSTTRSTTDDTPSTVTRESTTSVDGGVGSSEITTTKTKSYPTARRSTYSRRQTTTVSP